MICITMTQKDAAPQDLCFAKDEVTIGRFDGNDIILNDSSVSKLHAKFVLEDSQYVVIDMQSTNGTLVNGKKINATRKLTNADIVCIGDCIFALTPSTQRMSTKRDAADAEDSRKSQRRSEVQGPHESNAPRVEMYANLQKDIHNRLIEYLDLRRLDMDKLSSEALAHRTQTALGEIVERMVENGEIPDDVDRTVLIADVMNEALGLGPLEAFLSDDGISEIMVNHANQIYIEKDGKIHLSEKVFSSIQPLVM